MKQLYCLALFVLLLSCKENKDTTAENLDKTVQKDSTNVKSATNIATNENLVSYLRPNEKLKIEETYSDQVEFVNFDGNGDYALFTVQKNKKLVSFYTNLEDARPFKRGDILDVNWKMDTIYEAGEGEKQDFGEWLITAKKVKDGPVSLFRKKYKNPIKYYSEKEDTYTAGFQDFLSTEVEYYLANSKNEAVKTAIKDPETNFSYAVTEKQKGEKSYYVIDISTDFQHNSTILQSIYLDSATNILYEYDLPNDKLIKFD